VGLRLSRINDYGQSEHSLLLDMGLALCGELVGRKLAEAIELSMQYDPKPPYGTGDPIRFATSDRVQLIETQLRK
jgi:hypothetical protein